MSIAAYKRTIRESESPRQIERRILSRITGELEQSAQDFDAADGRGPRLELLAGGLRDSLAENQKIWGALRNDLADAGNRLPPELRASLLSLAMWVERQTTRALGGEPGVGALVTVNRHVIAGLSGAAPSPQG